MWPQAIVLSWKSSRAFTGRAAAQTFPAQMWRPGAAEKPQAGQPGTALQVYTAELSGGRVDPWPHTPQCPTDTRTPCSLFPASFSLMSTG